MTDRSNATGEPVRVPERCLSFVVRGDWAHFRRSEGISARQTYRIPPRMTMAGMIAAILGLDRDSYYQTFAKGKSAMAIEPLSPIETVTMGVTMIDTGDAMGKVNARGGGPTIQAPNMTSASGTRTQRTNHEYVIDPEYRVDVWVDDEDLYEELRTRLREGTAVYTPSLGLSELIASIDFVGEHEPTRTEASGGVGEPTDSVVWGGTANTQITPGKRISTERSHAFMSAIIDDVSGGTTRKTDEYVNIAWESEGGQLMVTETTLASVDGRTVMFH